ncbi:YihY/virulence factor BrkB family protein [Flavitalea antarctica]
MRKKLTFKGLWKVMKDSFTGFSDDKVLKLSGALAYYTLFSMAPLLIVIIFVCSLFFGRANTEDSIYSQIQGFVGPDTALQLQQIITNASLEGKSSISLVIGIITLIIGATTVFAEIQDSINMIWGLKPKPKKGWLKMLKNRLLSFSVIIGLGFLLLVSLGVSAILEALNKKLQAIFPDVTVVLFYILNLVITFSVITILFAAIFKVLPDALIKWRDVIAGSIATAILFMLGKFGISFYISQSNIGSTYGTAGSLVVLLLWVYYSAAILYFGAEFTKFYALRYGSAIHPDHYAVVTKTVEVEAENGTSVQQATKEVKEEKKVAKAEAQERENKEKG